MISSSLLIRCGGLGRRSDVRASSSERSRARFSQFGGEKRFGEAIAAEYREGKELNSMKVMLSAATIVVFLAEG